MKAHGVRGEMRLDPETDFPDRLLALREALLVLDGRPTTVTVEAVRRTGEGFLVKVAGIDDPEEAGRWRGADLAVSRGDAAALPEGRHYIFDVIGMSAVTEAGEMLGTVDEVIRTPANDVFVIRGPRGEILAPVVASVVLALDDAAGRVIIRPMPGMIDEDR